MLTIKNPPVILIGLDQGISVKGVGYFFQSYVGSDQLTNERDTLRLSHFGQFYFQHYQTK